MILGVKIDDVSREETVKKVGQWIGRRVKKKFIATINPEFLVLASGDKEFKRILNKADLRVVDGFGLKLMSGFKIKHRVTGIDLVWRLSQEASRKNWPVGLIGGEAGAAQAAGEVLKQEYPSLKIAFAIDGGEADWYLRRSGKKLKNSKGKSGECDVLFAAFGAVKQEKFIYGLIAGKEPMINFEVGIGVGGAFNFIAGKVSRAPLWTRNLGLEWLYRFIQEPKARIKRIIRAVVIFPLLVLKEKVFDFLR